MEAHTCFLRQDLTVFHHKINSLLAVTISLFHGNHYPQGSLLQNPPEHVLAKQKIYQ